jgi:hypothetical protein
VASVKTEASDFFPAWRALNPTFRISSPRRERKIRRFGFLLREASDESDASDFFPVPRAENPDRKDNDSIESGTLKVDFFFRPNQETKINGRISSVSVFNRSTSALL